jgi:hypothetical protein
VDERVCTLEAGEGDGHLIPPSSEGDGGEGEVGEDTIQEVFGNVQRTFGIEGSSSTSAGVEPLLVKNGCP